MITIKRYKSPLTGEKCWRVNDSKLKCSDICYSFGDAIRFFFWHIGVFPRICFRKYRK